MSQLQCNVSTCVNNNKGLCCLDAIHVEGCSARSVCETCCASFQEMIGASNYAVNRVPNERCEVLCDAQRCVYNSNGCCSAESITVGGDGACNCGDTCCRSFRERQAGM